jgi:uncharacterized protein YjbI with pentapeptide repeats
MKYLDKEIRYTEEQIKKLRARWDTPEGRNQRKQIQRKLENGDTDLGDLATFNQDDGLPTVPPGKDLRGITLSTALPENLDLKSLHLSASRLEGADFTGANFSYAHLEFVSFSGSILRKAIFRGAFLTHPNFVGADLEQISLSEAVIDGIQMISHRAFSHQGFADFSSSIGFIDKQYTIYSIIKSKYKSLGKYDEMIPFHILEMRARRDDRCTNKKTGRRKLAWYLNWVGFDLLCGYGEKWQNALLSAFMVILTFSFVYMIYPLRTSDLSSETTRWIDYLYFSAVNFSNLGSQDLLPYNSVHRFTMFSESVLGLFLITMLIVIFTRKIIRE